jgi:general secretion pathway protein B
MSFILDALRKSEHERQRQTGPGITDIRGAAVARSGLPPWALILGALLLINVLVVVVLAVRGSSTEKSGAIVSAPAGESAPVTSGAPAATVNVPAVAARISPSAPPGRAPDVTLRAQPSSSAGARTPAPEAPASTERAEEPVLRPAPKPEPAPTREPSAESYATLPTYGDVRLQGASLPEMHIDLHVYAAKPSDRLVFINTRKYREGGQTPDGTTIERIIPDGVVLNHHGVRFLLPRQ